MDLNQLYTAEDHEAGAEMRVKDQFGKKTDLYIKIAGMDSKRWRTAFSKHRHKMYEDGKDGTKAKAEYAADVCIDWRGATENGEPVEFSRDKALALFMSAPYIVPQIDVFAGDRVNFTKAKLKA